MMVHAAMNDQETIRLTECLVFRFTSSFKIDVSFEVTQEQLRYEYIDRGAFDGRAFIKPLITDMEDTQKF